MTTAAALHNTTVAPETMLKLIGTGDTSNLSPDQKLQYYNARCEAAGLDPRAQPFQFIKMQGKEVLYALKGATDQLAGKHGIVCEVVSQVTESGVRTVTVRARTKDGRQTDEVGCVAVGGKSGDELCNAYMKATTKAKRRAILSLCGLGMLDETELETIPAAVPSMTRLTPAPAPQIAAPVTQEPEVYTITEPVDRKTALKMNEAKREMEDVINRPSPSAPPPAPPSPIDGDGFDEAEGDEPSAPEVAQPAPGEQAFRPFRISAMTKEKEGKKGKFRGFLFVDGNGKEDWVNVFSQSYQKFLMDQRKSGDVFLAVLVKSGDFVNLDSIKGVSE